MAVIPSDAMADAAPGGIAAFVPIDDARGRTALEASFRRHADIAVRHGRGVILPRRAIKISLDSGFNGPRAGQRKLADLGGGRRR